MKKAIKFSMFMAIMSFAIMGCSKSDVENILDGSNAKLSPPSWLQGSWAEEDGGIVVFKITSDDVLMNIGVLTSLKTIYGFSFMGTGTTIKETKNNSSDYEITVTAKVAGKEQAAGKFCFKKGQDSNHILAAWNEEGDKISDWDTLVKK